MRAFFAKSFVLITLPVALLAIPAYAASTAHNDAASSSGAIAAENPLSFDQRINRLENQIQYLDTLSQKVQQHQKLIAQLQGQIETLEHEVGQLKNGQQSLNYLEQRVVQLEAIAQIHSQNSQAASETKQATHQSLNQDERHAFDGAYNQLMQKNYEAAIQSFHQFIKTYPKSPLNSDAHYWLGELYLVMGQPDKASQQFRIVIADAGSNKTPDAMLKLGNIFLAYGDDAHAKQMFEKLVAQYKETPAAELAASRLKEMTN